MSFCLGISLYLSAVTCLPKDLGRHQDSSANFITPYTSNSMKTSKRCFPWRKTQLQRNLCQERIQDSGSWGVRRTL